MIDDFAARSSFVHGKNHQSNRIASHKHHSGVVGCRTDGSGLMREACVFRQITRQSVIELLAIEDSWNDHEWEQLPPNVQSLFKRNALAAIAEVLDWLADPGDGAIEAGAIAVAPGIMVEGWDDSAGMRDSCRGDASDTWTAMLAAKRKEALGDEGEG